MTTDKKLEVDLLAPEISLAQSKEAEIKIQEEFKLIKPQQNILANMLLLLTFIGVGIILMEVGTIPTSRYSSDFNWPVIILCGLSMLFAFLVLNVSNQIQNTNNRIEQMEKILLEMYQNQKSKG